jgi:hypothetical protein
MKRFQAHPLYSSDRLDPIDRWNDYASAALGFLFIFILAAVIVWGPWS